VFSLTFPINYLREGKLDVIKFVFGYRILSESSGTLCLIIMAIASVRLSREFLWHWGFGELVFFII